MAQRSRAKRKEDEGERVEKQWDLQATRLGFRLGIVHSFCPPQMCGERWQKAFVGWLSMLGANVISSGLCCGSAPDLCDIIPIANAWNSLRGFENISPLFLPPKTRHNFLSLLQTLIVASNPNFFFIFNTMRWEKALSQQMAKQFSRAQIPLGGGLVLPGKKFHSRLSEF